MEGLRDSPRSGRPPKYDAEIRHRLQTRVCQQPEDQSRWSVRTLAAELGLPASTVHRMLVAAKLQPHRIRTDQMIGWQDSPMRLAWGLLLGTGMAPSRL